MPDAHGEHFPGPIHQPPLVVNVDAIQPGVHHEHPVHPKLQHHFDDMEQQVGRTDLLERAHGLATAHGQSEEAARLAGALARINAEHVGRTD